MFGNIIELVQKKSRDEAGRLHGRGMKEAVHRYLRENEWSHLGNGAFSAVYCHKKIPYVIKVSPNDAAACVYLSTCMQAIGRTPYIPEVYAAATCMLEGDAFGVFAIERLREVSRNKDREYRASEEVRSYKMLRDRLNVPPKYQVLVDVLSETEKYMKKHGSGIHYDLHNGNAMIRESRNETYAVLTDPVTTNGLSKKFKLPEVFMD
jgi:hypothetical protein